MSATTPSGKNTFDVKILRQKGPHKEQYWECHRIDYEPELNVISVLQIIARNARTANGKQVAPVAWDCNCLEEVCGACTMAINGRVRQACSALVDKLLEDQPDEITLEPMSKFPVVRDLMVDRSRMFNSLQRVKAWVNVDGYYDAGPGERQSQAEQEAAYPLSQCMTCGCCVEACPQYTKIELHRHAGESNEDFAAREAEAHERNFLGPAAISQAVLFNSNPIGKMNADERMEEIVGEGGIQICGNAQNCVAVCPKEIPLTTSIGKASRSATLYSIKRFFSK